MRVAFLALVALAVAGGAAFGIDSLVTGGSHTALCGVPAPLSSQGKSLLAADATRIRHTVDSQAGRVTGEGWDDPVTDRSRQLSFASSGRLSSEFVSVRRGHSEHTIWVIYDERTWLVDSTPLPAGPASTVDAASRESSVSRKGIEDGADSVIGRALVDGHETLHLRQVIHQPAFRARRPPGWPKGMKVPGMPAQTIRIDTWVDAETYLPVRTRSRFQGVWSQQDVSWLPRTPANVAKTALTIPAGFKRQQEASGNGTTFTSSSSSPTTSCGHS